MRLHVASDAIAATSAVSQGPADLSSHASELDAIGTCTQSGRAFAMRSDWKLRLPLAELHVDVHRSVTVTEYIPILQPSGDLIFPRISDQTLADNDVSNVRSEAALADSYVLIWHVASCLFHYRTIPGCIRTLRHLDPKWRFGINAPFFRPSWGFLRHMQKNQRLLNYGLTTGLVNLSYYTQKINRERTEFATYWLAEWIIDDWLI